MKHASRMRKAELIRLFHLIFNDIDLVAATEAFPY